MLAKLSPGTVQLHLLAQLVGLVVFLEPQQQQQIIRLTVAGIDNMCAQGLCRILTTIDVQRHFASAHQQRHLARIKLRFTQLLCVSATHRVTRKDMSISHT